jgi:hypothetical protein
MYTGTLKSKIRVHASNIIGWRTKRKIVVIESDDWGSIRTKSNDAYHAMLESGLNVDRVHYNSVDCLESNDDLEKFFDLLLEFKDSTGRPPVVTPMCIMANPDFEAIRESDFKEYFFEPLDKTLRQYPNHDRVIQLWQKGIEERLFNPGLHGREHLNANRYLELLQTQNKGIMTTFNNQSFGATKHMEIKFPNYQGAFHPLTKEEIHSYNQIIYDAGKLFEKYCGYKPSCFIAPNKQEPRELENILSEIGVKYMTRAKLIAYPVGDGSVKKELSWLGKKNKLGQLTIVRNCFFEPTSFGEFSPNIDWVGNCLKEVEIAFSWSKPAIISTHRVNFIGSLNPKSRDVGFFKTRSLLTEILKRWPETEFMTTEELGSLIAKTKGN